MGEGHKVGRTTRRQALRREVQHRHDRFYSRCAHWSFADDGGAQAQSIHWRREHWIVAATVTLMTLLSAVAIPSWAHAMKHVSIAPHTIVPLALPALSSGPAQPAPIEWQLVNVKPGQTLSDIFQAHGLGFGDVQRALDATTDSSVLRDIHPGDTFAFRISPQGNLDALRFDKDATHRVTLHFAGADATRTVQQRVLEHRQGVAHGVIQSSLFGAAAKAGMSDAMMVKLADVFKYDIDFIKDVRQGDHFTVIYDTVYRDGTYLHAGNILAAEFFNRGQRFTAYRFTQPNGEVGYYTQDGRPLQKSLLRTPVTFTRISSRFSRSRLHPILGYSRPHQGVDYAAPKGTPIHAASSGTITIRGWVHGYGRYVRIKMNGEYSTCYAHMSRFAAGLHVGSHVHQGEVIGYVGMSGLATGPHLHYEVRVDGKPVNPLTVTLPKPKPLPTTLLAKFEQQTQPLLARLKRVDNTVELAKAQGDAPPPHGAHAG